LCTAIMLLPFTCPPTPFSTRGPSTLRLICISSVTASPLEKSVFYMFQQHPSTLISSPKACRRLFLQSLDPVSMFGLNKTENASPAGA
jgi:hypothetical protein